MIIKEIIKKIVKMLVTVVIVMIAMLIILIIISEILYDGEKYDGRTKEEYMAVLLDNKEDFDYVAEMMQQWTDGSIHFDKKGISSRHQEIADEISNNEEFYGHLKNLYDLKEIDYILIEGDQIAFYFSKFPSWCHGGVFYAENIREDSSVRRKIDDHWMLYMIPNT